MEASFRLVLERVYIEAKDLEIIFSKLPMPGILPRVYIFKFKD